MPTRRPDTRRTVSSQSVIERLLGQAAPQPGLGAEPLDRGMNKLETAYAEHLAAELHAGRVLWFAFEPLKLRLAGKTFYTPDFLVQLADRSLELHEVKGHWEDDARVKIKVVAEAVPFKVIAITRQRSAWKREVLR